MTRIVLISSKYKCNVSWIGLPQREEEADGDEEAACAAAASIEVASYCDVLFKQFRFSEIQNMKSLITQ